MATWIRQSAAIPIRNGQICLVTSSNRRRWVIPKGMIDPGKTAGESALNEAWEEAGLVGVLNPEPVGSYLYEKLGRTCHVTVFVMRVTEVATNYPEKLLRTREWLGVAEAIERIQEAGLREILADLPAEIEQAAM